MPGEVQGLHAAPRAEVERPPHGSTHGPRREGGRGTPDAEHVVDAQRAPDHELGEVGGHPPVVGVVAVGAQVARRQDGAVGGGPALGAEARSASLAAHEAEAHRPVDAERRQGSGQGRLADRATEGEEAHEDAARVLRRRRPRRPT